jgi:dethiobiotin synthetase
MTSHEPPATSHGYFVTGTDTGVGKTLIACALLVAFVARGLKAVGMKPVASGAESGMNGLVNDDVENLVAAGNVAAPRADVNPYCFAPPIAPHIAAQQAGVTIALDRIDQSFGRLAARAEVIIVEGVGGFRVPLGPGIETAQLAERLALPVVLVVGMRLGCLNHALLTAEAITARGLKLAGWVANHVDAEMSVAADNVRALEERIAAPMIARISHARQPDVRAVAAALDVAILG